MTGTDTVVIGAGPYGLSVAAHLQRQRRRLPHLRSAPGHLADSDAARDVPEVGRFRVEPVRAGARRRPWPTTALEHDLPYHPTDLPVPLETFVAYGLDFQRRYVPEPREAHRDVGDPGRSGVPASASTTARSSAPSRWSSPPGSPTSRSMPPMLRRPLDGAGQPLQRPPRYLRVPGPAGDGDRRRRVGSQPGGGPGTSGRPKPARGARALGPLLLATVRRPAHRPRQAAEARFGPRAGVALARELRRARPVPLPAAPVATRDRPAPPRAQLGLAPEGRRSSRRSRSSPVTRSSEWRPPGTASGWCWPAPRETHRSPSSPTTSSAPRATARTSSGWGSWTRAVRSGLRTLAKAPVLSQPVRVLRPRPLLPRPRAPRCRSAR